MTTNSKPERRIALGNVSRDEFELPYSPVSAETADALIEEMADHVRNDRLKIESAVSRVWAKRKAQMAVAQ